jgi:intracellular septation protein
VEDFMTNLLKAGRFLLLDMASTLFFLVLYLLTHNVLTSVVLGMALGMAQIGWQFARNKPVDTMQWMSLFLLLGASAATLMTDDPRFVMMKPSVIYLIVGIVMLKPGWMNRYLPPVAIELVPDIAFIFGYLWSGLMFVSAIVNLIVAFNFSAVTWSVTMLIYGIASKVAMFLVGYAVMRSIGVARRRRQQLRDAGGDRPLDAGLAPADDGAAAPMSGAAPAWTRPAIAAEMVRAGNGA